MVARFNRADAPSKTTNLAGGQAYKQNPKLEFASILLTSFVSDQFYRKGTDTIARVQELLTGMPDKLFAAKAALYARNKYGMRSITHVVAGEIAKSVKGQEWTKRFFKKVVHRPDDILETLSYYMGAYQKPLPNSMKKGFASALSEMDEYKLAKYRGEGKAISMIDAVNLLHPKATPALTALMKGELKPAETWEVKLTQAGQKAETDEEKDELKGAAWKSLILENKLGYFALLRNLRNIVEQAPELVPQVCEQLVNPEAIKKSLVMPFRFLTALEALDALPSTKTRPIIEAINKAIEIALVNVPKFDGKTLIVVDKSGSMNGKPIHIASLFAAVLFKTNDAAVMMFANDAKYLPLNPGDSVATMALQIRNNSFGGGTDFHAPIKQMIQDRQIYDRVIILSDEQGWVGHYTPMVEWVSYKQITGANPHLYSMDLAGYGTLQFPEDQIYCMAGFSEKVFDIMKMLESDKNALVNEIEKVEI